MFRMTYRNLGVCVVLAAVVVGCGAADTSTDPGGQGSEPKVDGQEKANTVGSSTAQLSIAEQIVAANGQADRDMHLVARKVLNNGTEVAELYEPVPGQIMFSAAGSPLGKSVIQRDQIQGKTATEVWGVIAPGEAVPEALSQAIERSTHPDLATEPNAQSALAEPAQAEAHKAADPAVAVQANGQTLLSGGYCTNQFWTDFGNNWGQGAKYRFVGVYNFTWNSRSFSGITGTAGYAVCPQGDISGQGGKLTVNQPNGSNPFWNVAVNNYRWSTWTAGVTCGWDISCGVCNPAPFCQIGGTKCTPNGFNINARYDAASGSGDHYDWVSFASLAGSYCQ